MPGLSSRAVALAAGLALLFFSLSSGSAGCSSCSREVPSAVDAGEATTPELRAKLRAAARAKGNAYVPRTRHKDADGSPKFTNRLVLETSPYLLQHAHNPVDWFPWGDEAFETARRLGRPVLLSVGYSTCHWCHVMEEESFEDEEVAAAINAGYVAIKVDREERPDIDAIYMSAVQSLTGSGGWPMTVWLTPDRKPFHGGTYFPARDGDRGVRKGFLTLLENLKTIYRADPARVATTSARMTAGIQERMSGDGAAPAPLGVGAGAGTSARSASLDAAAAFYRGRFDDVNGGLQGAPKFPSTLPVRFLLRDHRRRNAADSLRMATLTLERMSRGGIHDQLGGGFHRYSTDERWHVPHFEKMLYDNALLAMAYVEGYQVTRREDFATVVRDILAYVERDMTSPDGAFFSATDADSLDPTGRREEGWFFTWTPAELELALGAASARAVSNYYGVTVKGSFEGRSILHVPHEASEPAVLAAVSEARPQLLRARGARPPPLRDEKVLTAWNALMISAHARAALALGEASYAVRAERAADFLLRAVTKKGRLLRSYKDGAAKLDAYLDDYAFMIAALLDLYEATGGQRWLEEAIRLDGVLEHHYEDKAAGGFFLTGDDHEKLLAREKPSYDGAEPCGNSIAALNLLRLHELTTRDDYRRRVERLFASIAGVLASSPASLSELLLALDYAADVPKEIVLVTASSSRTEAEPFLAKLREVFLPNRVLVVVPEGAPLTKLEPVVPLATSKTAQHGKTTAYVCEKRACELPTSDPEVFARLLRKRPTN